MNPTTRIAASVGTALAAKIILIHKVVPWMIKRSVEHTAEDENAVVSVVLPDGSVEKCRLNAPTVEEHNELADKVNPLLDRANAAGPDEPNPLTEDEIMLVISTLPEGSVYDRDPESGWGFH